MQISTFSVTIGTECSTNDNREKRSYDPGRQSSNFILIYIIFNLVINYKNYKKNGIILANKVFFFYINDNIYSYVFNEFIVQFL